MGFFSKTLQAAMPKMMGNPITTAVAMVSVALSVVKGQKAKKATKGKKKTTVRKSKILSKKQKQQMEVMERICQSAYGTYIRGATTVAARYIGHPAVAIPASEMIKTMMEEAAPTVNYLVQLKAEPKKESNIKEEKKPRIDKHISGRFEYLKGCTNGWYTGFTKAIKGEQVIDEKYTLENLFSGNLTIEDIPDYPEYMTMVGATIGAKYRGLWNSAKGTYDGVITLATEPEKVLEVASDAILDFMEHPIQNTKELAGNIRDDVVDAVWRSTPQEISEDAGEILGDVLTGLATGGGGKAAAGGAKMAGNKLLALGKTGAKEFVEGLGDLGKIGAKNAVYAGATTGIENASRNSFINRLMMMASEAGDEAKKLTGVAEGATSKADDIARIVGNAGSVTNTVTSTTGELIENAVIGTPIIEGTKNITKEIVEGTTEKTTLQMLEEATDNIATSSKVDDIAEAGMRASSKADDITEAGTKVTSKVDDIAGTGAKAGSKADDVAEARAKTSSKVDDIAETGAKASSKVDDVAEAGAKASSKVDDTAKAAGQTTAKTVARVESRKGKGRGGNVETSPAVTETKLDKVTSTETKYEVVEPKGGDKPPEIKHISTNAREFERLYNEGKINILDFVNECRQIDNVLDAEFLGKVEKMRKLIPGKIRGKGNFGYATVEISGLEKKELFAHSKIHVLDDRDKFKEDVAKRLKDISLQSKKQEFETLNVNRENIINGKGHYDRIVDTESKILEEINTKLKGNVDATGKIVMYTNLYCCPSCQYVFKQFKEKYPKIDVTIIYEQLEF